VFEFAESRAGAHPLLYLNKYKGYLQADAYSGHGALYERGDIIEVGCWAHCRRRFFEIAKAQKGPGLAAQALQWIARLYAIESRVKDQTPDIKLAAGRPRRCRCLRSFVNG
jgi:transposase